MLPNGRKCLIRVIGGFFVCLLAVTLSGCANAPETETRATVTVVVEDFLSDLPETAKRTVGGTDKEQVIDAQVICTPADKVTEGTLAKREFSEDEVRTALEESGIASEANQFQILTEDGHLFLANEAYAKNRGKSIRELEDDGEATKKVDALLAKLRVNQTVKTGTLQETEEGKKVFSFQTGCVFQGLEVEVPLSGAGGSPFSGYGDFVDGNLAELTIASDFTEAETQEAKLLDFESILSSFETLLKSGLILPTESGQPVEKIQMFYMAESTEEGYEYYPVWNFEVSYVADWLKDSEGVMKTRYVVLDARDGTLVDYNSGGA